MVVYYLRRDLFHRSDYKVFDAGFARENTAFSGGCFGGCSMPVLVAVVHII